MEITLSKAYPIGGNLQDSVQNALGDFIGKEQPTTICMFLGDIPESVSLEVTLLARFGDIQVGEQSLRILSGNWWQTFTPGNFAFLLSPSFF